MSDPEALVTWRLFAHVAHELAEQPDLAQTTQRLMELATQLTGCGIAAVWELSPNGAHTSLKAATDHSFGQALDAIITGVDDGMVHDALTQHATVHMPDVARETRWPRYVTALQDRQLPIGSAIAYSLDLGEEQLGALALYAGEPDFFTDTIIAVGGVLADHATIALETAILADRAHHLGEALKSNRRIGMAIGIIMALHRVEEKQAFDILRIASQHTHFKLRDLAEQVILTGATPQWQPRSPA